MNHLVRSYSLGIILILVASLSGCTPTNEKQAKIVGRVDTSTNLSPRDAKAKAGSGQGFRPSNYPKPK